MTNALYERETLYHVTANEDKIEGRGRIITVGWFVSEDVAKQAAEGQGGMGSPAHVTGRSVWVLTTQSGEKFIVGESINTSKEKPEVVRNRALQKIQAVLSAEEQKALGL